MTEKKPESPKRKPEPGTVTREELQQVMADPSYSAGERESWLKEVLTRLTSEPRPGQSQRRLIREVRDIILDVRNRDADRKD